MMPVITFEECDDWGARLLLDGEVVAEYTQIEPDVLRALLTRLGVECEIEMRWEDE